MCKGLVCKKEDIKSNNKKEYNMFNFNSSTKEDIKEHNPHRPQIPDHTCRILTFEFLDLEKQMHCVV